MDKLFVLAQTWGLISIPKYDLGEAADVVREEQKHRSSLTHWESSRLPLVSHGVLISRHADHTRPSSKTSSAGPAGDDTQGLSSTHFGGSLKKKKSCLWTSATLGAFRQNPTAPNLCPRVSIRHFARTTWILPCQCCQRCHLLVSHSYKSD